MLRYLKVIKSFSISSPSVNALSLSITRNPYFCCQQLRHNSQEILVGHVGVYVIVVHMFQIDTILFEKNQEICVVAYKMLWYLCICLTEIKRIDIRVSTHWKVLSYRVLLVAGHVKDKDRIWKRLTRWYDVTVIKIFKITSFFYRRK